MLASWTATSDASLVTMIAEGRDRGAAEAELCTRYRQRVYLYGLRHLRDAAAAEDLVQDVLTTVIERARAGEIQDPARLGSFVLGTARFKAIGRKRTEARKARILAMYGDARIDEHVPPPMAPQDIARVSDCLARLADRDRTVLLLSFYAELDTETVARELGLDAPHVRVLRQRALGRLQKCVTGGREEA